MNLSKWHNDVAQLTDYPLKLFHGVTIENNLVKKFA